MTDKIIRVKIEAGDSQQEIVQLDKAMTSAGASADQLNDELLGLSQGLKTNLTPTARAVSQAVADSTDGLNKFSRSAGQAGIQVQQLVGQVTAGTNPLVAFSQQAADIGIVLGAPMLGAVIGISAAIGSVLVPSLLAGKTKAEELNDALSDLRDVSGTTEDGIYLLNEQIVELAKSSEAAAKVKLAANLIEATDAAKLAADAFEDVFDVGRLQFAIDVYTSGISALGGIPLEVVGITRKIGEQFGLTGQAAKDFGIDVAVAIGNIQKAPTTGNFDNFINLISGQTTATGTKKTTELAGALLDFASKGRQAAVEGQNAQAAIDNLGKALEDAKQKTDNTSSASENYERRLRLQNISLKEGELAANLQAAAWALGKDSVNDLDQATIKLINENYRLSESKKQLTKDTSDLNQEITAQARLDAEDARRAARERQRINERILNMQLETQTFASQTELMRAVRSEQFTQEEADLASQTAGRLLAANNEFALIMSNKQITDDQKIAAEIAFQERIKAINEQYAQGQIDLKRYQLNQEIQAYGGFANSAIQLVSAFGSKSFQAQKNAAIATSLVNIAGGVAQALNNPFPANLGFAAKVAAEGATLLNTIKSTNIGSSGSGVGVGSGGASATIPTTPTAAPVVGSFEIAGLSDLQRQLDNLDSDEVLPVSFTRRLVASLQSVQRLEGSA